MRIGILGGSFNPPHEGHIHASHVALRTLCLDCVWWLVTPQNPLKNQSSQSFEQRFAQCETLADHPHIVISDLERQMGTSLTWQTIRGLRTRFPLTGFVWITGMDNALTMHRWHNWTDILDNVATAHVARPPAWSLIEDCPLRMKKTQKHIFLNKAVPVSLTPRRTYWLLQKKMVPASSSALRRDEREQA